MKNEIKICTICKISRVKNKNEINCSCCRLKERAVWFYDLKSGPCVDCGKTYDTPYAMDFDHIPGKGAKVDSVSQMMIHQVSKEDILAEIAKCELVCVFCHKTRTLKRLNNNVAEEISNKRYLMNTEYINKVKQNPCEMCGEFFKPEHMEFDHINPEEKIANICQMTTDPYYMLHIEINKCQVLCILCHRLKTIGDRKISKYKTYAEPLSYANIFCDMEAKIKQCDNCNKKLPFDDFNKNKAGKGGLNNWCKICQNEYTKKYTKIVSVPLFIGPIQQKQLKRHPVIWDPVAKTQSCSGCKEILSADCFALNTNHKTGLAYYCKKCQSAYDHAAFLKRQPPEELNTFKDCKKCLNTKCIAEYRPCKANNDGRSDMCRDCTKIYNRKNNK